MKGLAGFLSRHGRFYSALICGLLTALVAHLSGFDAPLLAGGNVFYLVFLGLCLVMVARQKPADLKRRAKTEDEGIVIVLLITLATMAFFCDGVFTALNRKHGLEIAPLVLSGVGAVAGWMTLHTVMAFHYANIHYFDDPDCVGDEKDLAFPGQGDPGSWDFLYYSFVVGMTAQVSDVQVLTTVMRRATLLHGIVSFFFNTVFIAMAVNAGVALAAI
ncbi:MAG TPA: DUF1345 domain-containing protein [Rhizomicrobium sp.]|nr:DUF1345 domain-containing protein [Rhizomicrobium sp.]